MDTFSGLAGKQMRLAKKIHAWANQEVNGSTPVDHEFYTEMDWLFRPTYSYCFSTSDGRLHSSESHGFLHILYDGGLAYDLFAINGDAEYMGIGRHWPLIQFIESLGYYVEQTDNICLSISEVDA